MAKRNYEDLTAARDKVREGRAEEAALTTKLLLNAVEASSTSIHIALDDLTENPYNSRSVYLPEQVEDKKRSMLQSGQATPILVARMADGVQIVIDGWTRTKAARQINSDENLPPEKRNSFKTLEAVVREDLTIQQIAALSYVANEEHKGLRDIDRAFAYHKALKDKVFETQEALAQAYGIDRTVVSRIHTLATASDVLLDIVRAHPEKLTYSFMADVLSSNLSVDQQAKLLNEVVTHDKSVTWLRTKVLAYTSMVGGVSSRDNVLQMDAAIVKWSPAARAKSIELTFRSKSEQLNMLRLLKGLCAHTHPELARLAELFEDESLAQKLMTLVCDPPKLQSLLVGGVQRIDRQ